MRPIPKLIILSCVSVTLLLIWFVPQLLKININKNIENSSHIQKNINNLKSSQVERVPDGNHYAELLDGDVASLSMDVKTEVILSEFQDPESSAVIKTDSNTQTSRLPRSPYSSFKINQMHGPIGFLPTGVSTFKLQPPPNMSNVSLLLREGGGFNMKKSDSISLDRDVYDNRHDLCKKITYDIDKLDSASVVVVFHNEGRSTLLRTIHSILNRTHPDLLDEIILIDDYSNSPWLKSKSNDGTGELEYHLKYLPKVRLVRLEKRMGLVAARLKGIEETKSKIFVILDSHVEVQYYWLEPLLHQLSLNNKTVVMPQIDGIKADTFDLVTGGIGCTLGFIWRLMEHAVPDQYKFTKDRESIVSPLPSPAMAGGLFGSYKDFFNDIGSYDNGMSYWGVENLELSFRLWQCGGRLECVPCSRVYHVFREGGKAYDVPYDSLMKNKLRVMNVWMGDYKALAMEVLEYPTVQYGNIDKRLELSKQCKSFDWYLKEIWPESYITDLSQVPYMGQIRSMYNNNYCVDTKWNQIGNEYGVSECKLNAEKSRNWLGQGFMLFSKPGHIMPTYNDEACLAENKFIEWCDHIIHSWVYENNMLRFSRVKNIVGTNCLTLGNDYKLYMEKCDNNNIKQKWEWRKYDFKLRQIEY